MNEPRFETLVLDRAGTDGRIGRITLNRPERLNSLSPQLLAELDHALHLWETDDTVRVIVLRGAGRAFSAGYDVTALSKEETERLYVRSGDERQVLLMKMRAELQRVVDLQLYFWNMAKVTVAEIHGHCLAGGCELAMMADLVVAADDTRIGHPGVRGMGYPRNGTMWPLLVGMRRAKELSLSGDTISGTEAERIGMINHAWPAAELEQRTIEYADRFAIMSADHLALIKNGCNRWYENMGLYSSIRSSTEMDLIGQCTEEALLWREQLIGSVTNGKGIKPAFQWRDGRYDRHPGGRARTED